MNSSGPSCPNVVLKTVNGTKMFPLGKLPVTLCLGDKNYQDDVHIYPNVHGTLISWKANKALQNINIATMLSKLHLIPNSTRNYSYSFTQPHLGRACYSPPCYVRIFYCLTLKGYHQCLLDHNSEALTTYITPFGRYNTSVPHTAYLLYQKIMTARWLRPSLDSQGFTM